MGGLREDVSWVVDVVGKRGAQSYGAHIDMSNYIDV